MVELKKEDCNFAAIRLYYSVWPRGVEGFAPQKLSIHAFVQAACRAAKKQQIKPNKQPNNQTTKRSTNHQIARKPNNQPSNQPRKQIQQTTPNQNKSNQNKTRKKQTKQINHPTTNQPTQPNEQTNNQTKQKTTEPQNEEDPFRNYRILQTNIWINNMPEIKRTKRCACYVEFYMFLNNSNELKFNVVCRAKILTQTGTSTCHLWHKIQSPTVRTLIEMKLSGSKNEKVSKSKNSQYSH